MLKETGYQEKIEMLTPWLEEIFETIKRDLKNEHLKVDRQFCKKYLLGKSPGQITVPEMVEAYRKDIAVGNESLGEFIATRWLLKNTDIYGYFEEKIKALSDDFEKLEVLPQDLSDSLMHSSVTVFGAKKTYVFSVFNSVVFPQSTYMRLKELASEETHLADQAHTVQRTHETLEAMHLRHSREIAALTDRFEKKINGMQKKYLADVEALKKQVALLQKKLAS